MINKILNISLIFLFLFIFSSNYLYALAPWHDDKSARQMTLAAAEVREADGVVEGREDSLGKKLRHRRTVYGLLGLRIPDPPGHAPEPTLITTLRATPRVTPRPTPSPTPRHELIEQFDKILSESLLPGQTESVKLEKLEEFISETGMEYIINPHAREAFEYFILHRREYADSIRDSILKAFYEIFGRHLPSDVGVEIYTDLYRQIFLLQMESESAKSLPDLRHGAAADMLETKRSSSVPIERVAGVTLSEEDVAITCIRMSKNSMNIFKALLSLVTPPFDVKISKRAWNVIFIFLNQFRLNEEILKFVIDGNIIGISDAEMNKYRFLCIKSIMTNNALVGRREFFNRVFEKIIINAQIGREFRDYFFSSFIEWFSSAGITKEMSDLFVENLLNEITNEAMKDEISERIDIMMQNIHLREITLDSLIKLYESPKISLLLKRFIEDKRLNFIQQEYSQKKGAVKNKKGCFSCWADSHFTVYKEQTRRDTIPVVVNVAINKKGIQISGNASEKFIRILNMAYMNGVFDKAKEKQANITFILHHSRHAGQLLQTGEIEIDNRWLDYPLDLIRVLDKEVNGRLLNTRWENIQAFKDKLGADISIFENKNEEDREVVIKYEQLLYMLNLYNFEQKFETLGLNWNKYVQMRQELFRNNVLQEEDFIAQEIKANSIKQVVSQLDDARYLRELVVMA